VEIQSPDVTEPPDVLEGRRRFRQTKGDRRRTAEIIHAEAVHEPFRRTGISTLVLTPETHTFPIVQDESALPSNSRHGLALDSRGLDDPTQPNANDQNEYDQPLNVDS
jgi:hypothetical protein